MEVEITKYIYDTLSDVMYNGKAVPVFYAYPTTFKDLPLITYSEGNYSNPVRTLDQVIRTYDLTFYIDIWAKTALESVSVAQIVREKLKAAGFTPSSLGEIYENETKTHHLRIVANGTWDIYENKLY